MPTRIASSSDLGPKRMKGIGFANVRQYVVTTYGNAAWLSVINALASQDRLEVEASVAIGWYDTYLFARLLRTVDAVCGAGDLGLLHRVGMFEAELDLGRTLRLLIRVLHPSSIFKAERRLWGHFHDSGQWTFASVERGIDGRLEDWAVDAALCRELSGYLVRMVEFTGGKSVNVTHPECRASGASHCVYQFRWS